MTKEDLRRKVWQLLEHNAVQRFPGAHGRIPNFIGAERAAARLTELAVWKKARTIKMSPDAPQLAVRRQALIDGKVIYLAVPALRTEKCFIEIDPKRLGRWMTLAASLLGAAKYGRLVSPWEVRAIDLVVCGSVGVRRDGTRVGKGGGYVDLEYALLREEGKLKETTPIVTTVHPLQIVTEKVAMLAHDIPLDFLVTPFEVVATRPAFPRPRGIYWDLLKTARIEAIPSLRKRLKQASPDVPSRRL
ncbi:MAG: 5-formyltetrahydrofolate cyclo-ligase [Deltaproteobacteria bacterium]|nr:5-formyltetrahydrofolate cyclo-ligase [Deltaproteobacteria bacterium]